jgi:hypothetical protein
MLKSSVLRCKVIKIRAGEVDLIPPRVDFAKLDQSISMRVRKRTKQQGIDNRKD